MVWEYIELNINYILVLHVLNYFWWINLACLSALAMLTRRYHESQTLKPRTSAISSFCKIFMWKVYIMEYGCKWASNQTRPNYGATHLATALLVLHGVKCFSTKMAGIKVEQGGSSIMAWISIEQDSVDMQHGLFCHSMEVSCNIACDMS